MTHRRLLMILPLCLGACDGDDPPVMDVAMADFPAAYALAFCAKLDSCCSAAERARLAFYGTDQASCQESVRKLHEINLQMSLEGGRVGYRADLAGQCTSRLASQSCGQFAFTEGAIRYSDVKDDPCVAFLEPLAEIGSACGANWECKSASCRGASGQKVCEVLGGVGEACKVGLVETCAAGLFCDAATAVCKTQLANGVSCRSDGDCRSYECDSDRSVCVDEPLVCDSI